MILVFRYTMEYPAALTTLLSNIRPGFGHLIVARLQYAIAHQAKQSTHQCNTESCVGHYDHSGISVHNAISGWSTHSPSEYKVAIPSCDDSGIPVTRFNIRLTVSPFYRIFRWVSVMRLLCDYSTRLHQANQFTHQCNTVPCVGHYDHSQISVHDAISGWSTHSPSEYKVMSPLVRWFWYSGTRSNIRLTLLPFYPISGQVSAIWLLRGYSTR